MSGTNSITTASSALAAKDDGGSSNSTITTVIEERKCTTFIVLCPPQTFVHLCSLAPNQTLPGSTEAGVRVPITSWSQIDIESDVQPWSFHPKIDDEHSYLLHFPFYKLDSDSDNDDVSTKKASEVDIAVAYQCTQAEDGQLTHFFHGNYHATDFSCPIGTPLYSPANGIVVSVKDHVGSDAQQQQQQSNNTDTTDERSTLLEEVSGIAARNLFYWNSIMIKVKDEENEALDPLYIEFVHIQTNSVTHKVGDTVRKGQLICRSGSVGFSPEPHLHLAAYRSNDNEAATVRVRFESTASCNATHNEQQEPHTASFLPKTGGWYNKSGLITTS